MRTCMYKVGGRGEEEIGARWRRIGLGWRVEEEDKRQMKVRM